MEIKKAKHVKLEGKRKSLFLMGTLASLSVILMAFEWSNTNITRIAPELLTEVFLENEKIIEVNYIKPKPRKLIIPPVVIDQVKVVDKTEKKDSVIVFLPEENPIAKAGTDGTAGGDEGGGSWEDTLVLDNTIKDWADKMPEYPGGLAKLYEHLGKKAKFSKQALEWGISGKVFLSFVVEKDGSVTDIKVLKGLGYGLDKTSIKALETMENWSPGRQGINNVRVRMKLPISYKFGN